MTLLTSTTPRLQLGLRYIETGLYLGESMAWAAQQCFTELYGIELDLGRAMQCAERFVVDPRIEILSGSSPDTLAGLLQRKGRTDSTLFYLDAHYTGEGEAYDNGWGQCPVLAELAAVFAAPWTVAPTLWIDDAHMFDSWDPEPELYLKFRRSDWPLLPAIQAALPAGYSIDRHNNILACVPWSHP